MITMSKATFDEMLAHAKADYPHECCGLMIGRFDRDDDMRWVSRVERARNLNTERAHDRFELDPLDFLRVERALADSDDEIVGFYHSHPDHPPRPSATDAARAFEVYSYIIVGVQHRERTLARSWRFAESRAAFDEELLRVNESAVVEPSGTS